MEDTEDVNPMNSLGNLSDVMLVLAVGMMLALVVAWNLDLVGVGTHMSPATSEGIVELTPQDKSVTSLTDEGINFGEYGLKEYGTVYTDSEGNMYVIGELDEEK